MSDNDQTYHNLQDYLESCFKDIEIVTDAMILQAKQEWRKIYLSRYQKQYRERYIQISFRISKKQYHKIEQQAKQQNISVTTSIKRTIIQGQNTTNTADISSVTVIILEVIDLLEEAIQEDSSVDVQQLLSLIQQCHTLLNDSKSPVS